MARYSDNFQAFVNDRLDRCGLSDREVSRRSRGAVSHYTIGRMRGGEVPHAEYLVDVARVIGDDPNDWLDAADKPHLRFVRRRETASVRHALAAQ